MTRVKNMGRQQQKAVFAKLGNKPSSVSNMTARRENLMRSDLTTETRQDKIDKIMRDNRLTHRQKMDRIAKLKNGSSSRSDTATSISSEGTNRVDAPAVKLIYQKVLDKAEKRRLQRKAYLKKHPGAIFIPTKKPGVYLLKERGKTFVWKDGKKVKKKDMGYKELKRAGVKLKPNKDYDGDGVKNSKDCRPMNKKKQDLFDTALTLGVSAAGKGAKVGSKYAKKKLYERTPKGRAEVARSKIAKIEAKERAERFNKEQKIKAKKLEIEAKQRKEEYKKEHPSIFARVSKRAKERLSRKKSIYD